MQILSKKFEPYTSINEAIIKINKIKREKIVCLIISIFIFSLLLSFIIDLYNLAPLTANAKVAGIINKFCSNKVIKQNNIPFPVPKVNKIDEIVYPSENPLNVINA